MDSERFGKALGVGAREAAKALVKAADAAASPAPARPVRREPVVERPVAARTRPIARAQAVRGTAKGVREGGKRFGEALWGPFAKLSGVLWLEVTGVLFGMFAAVSGIEAWRGRGAIWQHTVPDPGRSHEIFALVMCVVFAYFTATSFLNAKRHSRR